MSAERTLPPLRASRDRLGWTQQRLANELSVSLGYVAGMEQKEAVGRRPPRLVLLAVAYLVGRHGTGSPG